MKYKNKSQSTPGVIMRLFVVNTVQIVYLVDAPEKQRCECLPRVSVRYFIRDNTI